MANQLLASLSQFSDTLASSGSPFAGQFHAYASPQALPAHESLPLGADLQTYFSHYQTGCTLRDSSISLCAYDKLPQRQAGFALPPGWLVFADFNDDPIAANPQVPGTEVWAAIEGTDFKLIAPTLKQFFAILTTTVAVSFALEDQAPDAEEDFEAYLEYHDTVVKRAIMAQLHQQLPNDVCANLEGFLYS